MCLAVQGLTDDRFVPTYPQVALWLCYGLALGQAQSTWFDRKNAAMKVCFVGLENLPVLAPEYNHHGVGGETLQQTLLAKALVARGYQVSMVGGDYGQSDAASWHGVTTFKAYRAARGLAVLRFGFYRWR